MAITEDQEERTAQARGRSRQDRNVPLLINQDDGRLFPNVPLVARNPKYRPYTGPKNASLQERMDWLKGLPSRTKVVFTEPEPFDIGKADKDSLIAFASSEFGVVLDDKKGLRELRKEVAALAEIDTDAGTGTQTGE